MYSLGGEMETCTSHGLAGQFQETNGIADRWVPANYLNLNLPPTCLRITLVNFPGLDECEIVIDFVLQDQEMLIVCKPRQLV